MKQNKEILKKYFETGDKPTQQQYAELIDSYVDSKQPEGKANRRFVIDEPGEVNVAEEERTPEYNLSDIVNNKLSLLKDGITVKEVDLTPYIDDTNLARLVSGTVDNNGVATFTRDDNSTFTVDLSNLKGSGATDVSSLVPYTGATQDVDLGSVNIRSDKETTVGSKQHYTPLNIKGRDFIRIIKSITFDNSTIGLGESAALNYVGSNGIAIGHNALKNASLGSNMRNIAIGPSSMMNGGGQGSIAIGSFAMQNVTANNTVAIGNGAMNVGGGQNSTAVGTSALGQNTGYDVIGLGYRAGAINTGNEAIFIGEDSGFNNNSMHVTSVGHWSGKNNAGSASSFFGHNSGGDNTGSNSTLIGYWSGKNNTGVSASALGYYAMINNSGLYTSAIGNNTLSKNEGDYCNAMGQVAGERNLGNNSVMIGNYSGRYNKENWLTALGNDSGSYNTGKGSTSIGFSSGKYADKDFNTFLGYLSQSGFNDDSINSKSFTDLSVVDIATNRITINNHGFGTNGSYVNLRYNASDGHYIGGLHNNSIFIFLIVDSNTIEIAAPFNISTLPNNNGTTVHRFTPQFEVTNSTAIGYNSVVTKSNQVVLGNSNVQEVFTKGDYVTASAGKGLVLTTPDNTKQYRLSIDNAGSLAITLI
ncbi:hypothetical protein F7018_00290 [Tenacibaculum aiptasiae]|uniref:Trimeric autotransporter adhesin YadA-like head domain-containing protein n=1 Tax=Tenacibaculum aiptasiae TaxID=426481 RepID=A0A7J5ATT1_9FLAO|nr:hypothetical protein [Tenacibaculum aiptasiae]KAB1160350.1 hypothetical protein F7018_00290 [Tenacibaculum aiptasiae]